MKKIFLLLFIISFKVIAQNKDVNNIIIDSTKTKMIDGITIISKKKLVEHLPDRIIYNFTDQPILNSGSIIESLKKIPGIIASESVDIMYQGKSLDVYMDGRPLKISGSSLISFLEGLPANSVDRIEIITSPGAEYAATSGNAIINIISSKKAYNYTTLIYSGNYSFSDYNKLKNKTNNNIFLASKFKNLNWKINLGQNYKENMFNNKIINILELNNDKILRYNYIRPNVIYNLKNSRIAVDYDLSYTDSDNSINDGININHTKNKLYRNDLSTSFQKIYNDNQKKFEAKFIYSNINANFYQNIPYLKNTSNEVMYSFYVDYSNAINFFDKSKINLGSKYDNEDIQITNNNLLPLEFKRKIFASYAEFQSSLNNLSFILGLRGENYNNIGLFSNDKIIFNEFKIYPNINIQYNFMKSVFLTANYNRKIKLPSTNNLNPYNTIFENSSLSYSGNPYLNPSLYNNYSLKFSAFDYATISYDISNVKNDIMFFVQKRNNKVIYNYKNAPGLTIHTFSMGLPIPLMIFNKGLKELMKFNFDINKINILYFYTDYQKYKSSFIDNDKGVWSFFASGQFILFKNINLQTIYKITSTGNYRYYIIDKPLQNSLDVNINTKFFNDILSISIYGNDILNTNKTVAQTLPTENNISIVQKLDTRNFGISLNYKILNYKKDEISNNKLEENTTNDKDILISK